MGVWERQMQELVRADICSCSRTALSIYVQGKVMKNSVQWYERLTCSEVTLAMVEAVAAFRFALYFLAWAFALCFSFSFAFCEPIFRLQTAVSHVITQQAKQQWPIHS